MTSPTPSSQRLPAQPVGRSGIASPKVNAEEVELNPIQNGEAKPSLPLEEDIMQCARLGEVSLIQKLFEGGKFNAKYKDEEGITPLHV